MQHLEMWFIISCTKTCRGTATHHVRRILVIRAAANAVSRACIFLCPHLGVGSTSPNGGQLLVKPHYNRAGELESISVPEDDLWGISSRGLV